VAKNTINMNRVHRDTVDRYLRYYKLNPRGGLAERCLRLQTRFHTLAASHEIQLSVCEGPNGCGGQSDAALPVCPFCGEGGLLEPDAPDPTLPDLAPDTWTTALVLSAVEGATPGERLDRCMLELATCAKAHRANLYRVGCLLRQIRDEELWRERFDGRGHPLYTGYADFVESEVHIGRSQATKLIRCVEEFQPEEFERWGASRLYFSLRLPEHERKEFLEETSDVPQAQLAGRANKRKVPESGPFPRMPKSKRVVQAIPLGQVIARLYARPPRNHPVGVVTRDAVSLADDPWTQVQITDDLWARITIRQLTDGTGALAAGFELRQGKLIQREDGR
jgi:hypothetical protein